MGRVNHDDDELTFDDLVEAKKVLASNIPPLSEEERAREAALAGTPEGERLEAEKQRAFDDFQRRQFEKIRDDFIKNYSITPQEKAANPFPYGYGPGPINTDPSLPPAPIPGPSPSGPVYPISPAMTTISQEYSFRNGVPYCTGCGTTLKQDVNKPVWYCPKCGREFSPSDIERGKK